MNRIEHKVGEDVIALESYQSIEKGKVYGVEAICYCPICGEQSVDVGTPLRLEVANKRCSHDQAILLSEYRRDWYSSSRFASINNKSEALEAAIKVEDYELAAILRDL